MQCERRDRRDRGWRRLLIAAVFSAAAHGADGATDVDSALRPYRVESVDPADGRVELSADRREVVTRTVLQTVTTQRRLPDGQVVEETATKPVQERLERTSQSRTTLTIGPRDHGMRGSGAMLAAGDVLRLLRPGDAVLLSPGDALDPAWTGLLRDEAIVLFAKNPPPRGRTVAAPAGDRPSAPRPSAAPPAPRSAPMALQVLPPPGSNVTTPTDADLRQTAGRLLAAVNRERQGEKLPALTLDNRLMLAAQAHSVNMARQKKLDHVLDDKTAGDRVTAAGYPFSAAAENIAEGQRTVDEAMDSWMHSEGHKANILGADVTQLGIGLARDADGTMYWTQVFARPLTN